VIGRLKLGGAVVAVLALLAVCWKVEVWRERSALLNDVQKEYADYRLSINQQLAERDRQESINREITSSYIDVMAKQDAALIDARKRLAGVRLRVCPALPAAPPATEAASAAPAESTDRLAPVVAADDVAERFARCDATAARLNALIDWATRN
jgi:hypothetical protein